MLAGDVVTRSGKGEKARGVVQIGLLRSRIADTLDAEWVHHVLTLRPPKIP